MSQHYGCSQLWGKQYDQWQKQCWSHAKKGACWCVWSSSAEFNSLTIVGGSLLRSRSSSKYGLAVIELRGSSEDGEDIDDSIPIVNHSTPKESNKIKPRFSTRETNHFAPNGELMWERPSLTSSRTEWVHEPDEVEEVLEKGNPPRRPARR